PADPVFPISCIPSLPPLLSFPTRRSSDLENPADGGKRIRARYPQRLVSMKTRLHLIFETAGRGADHVALHDPANQREQRRNRHGDRKSTRLNSSHQIISHAVFCLNKKKNR